MLELGERFSIHKHPFLPVPRTALSMEKLGQSFGDLAARSVAKRHRQLDLAEEIDELKYEEVRYRPVWSGCVRKYDILSPLDHFSHVFLFTPVLYCTRRLSLHESYNFTLSYRIKQ